MSGVRYQIFKKIKGADKKLKIDYEFKAKVLNTNFCKLVNEIDKSIYAYETLISTGEIIKCKYDYDTALKKRFFYTQNYPREYKEAERLNKARYKRYSRLKKRITYFLEHFEKVSFITLTFSDATLANTNELTRRRYVNRILSETSPCYVANIDFGAKNHREHYHAVAVNDIDLTEWSKLGFFKVEPVKSPTTTKKRIPKRYSNLTPEELSEALKKDDTARLSKYVAKLTNHAIKETTRRSAIIYSR